MTKTSLLLFYLRLFGTPRTRPGFRRLIHITQVLVLLWLIASVIVGIFRCHPIHDIWNPLVVGSPDVRDYCMNNNSYYISVSVFNVVLDFWILLLPLSIVWTLMLSARRKVGLSAIFLLGALYVSYASIIPAVCIGLRPLLTQYLRREYCSGIYYRQHPSVRFLM